jgi:uncharacterized membrane protein
MKNNTSVNISTLSALALASFISSANNLTAREGPCKCYGIAKAGENDCASLKGEYSCSGESKEDNAIETYRVVASLSKCRELGGFTEKEAREKLVINAPDRKKQNIEK